MSPLLLPQMLRRCSAKSRSFLLGRPAGLPAGASTWTAPALRRFHRATENRGQNKISLNRVSTVSGEPRSLANRRFLRAGGRQAGQNRRLRRVLSPNPDGT